MLTPEIKETAERLVALIKADDEGPQEVTASEARDICRDILEAARVEDLGGCPLCQR